MNDRPRINIEHPANTNLDFYFNGSISKNVLCNYLSRALIVEGCSDGRRLDDDLRMILNTGAKYITRAGGGWVPTNDYVRSLAKHKEAIAAMHRADSELVLEACIFENITAAVNGIAVPPWVLTAFDQPMEERCFRYDDMIFKRGRNRDRFGPGCSVPDMSRVEARLFFYYLACQHIDVGYEALHLGQVHLMGARDKGWVHWTELLNKFRGYANEHARHNFVLINAHTFGILGSDGRLLFDFHGWPVRGRAPKGSVPHPASENDPQEILPGVGLDNRAKSLAYKDSIFRHSQGGLTHSGWSCDSLPFLVELDNWNGYDPELLDQPSFGEVISWWGFDEISWFANQPRWYRTRWLEQFYNWVRATDPAGYLEMPGRRTAALRQEDGSIRQAVYSASNTDGFGDEDAIRSIWVAGHQGESDQRTLTNTMAP
jgi:hypothetical protein